MQLINVIDEDFINYKIPSMSLMFPNCNMKCNHDAGRIVCQNQKLIGSKTTDIAAGALCQRYLDNPITSAIVCYGMEPFDSRVDLYNFIKTLRETYKCNDPIVIYTGYTEKELEKVLLDFIKFSNIIIKFGRFIPDLEPRFDEILGVTLASKNQYARYYK